MAIKISFNSGRIKFLIHLSVFISALCFVMNTDAGEKKDGRDTWHRSSKKGKI